MTSADENHLDEPLTRFDHWGEEPLTEHEEPPVRHGPLRESCKAHA